MTKVPPDPTPAPARVCPECGRSPQVGISWRGSRAIPWAVVLLATVVLLAATLWNTQADVIVKNSPRIPARPNLSILPGCYTPGDLRAMADGIADPASFMGDVRRYIERQTENDATPGRQVFIGLGGPEGKIDLTWKVGWPWTFYTANRASDSSNVRTGASSTATPADAGLRILRATIPPSISAQRFQWQSATGLRTIEFPGAASTVLLLVIVWHASKGLAVRRGRTSQWTPVAAVTIVFVAMAAMALLQSRNPSDIQRKVSATPFASVPRAPMPPPGSQPNDAVIDLDELVRNTRLPGDECGQKTAALIWRQLRSIGWDSGQYVCLAVSPPNPRTVTYAANGKPVRVVLMTSEMGDPLPPRPMRVDLSSSLLKLQLPRRAQGTESTEIVVNLDAVLYAIFLCYTLFQLTRFTQYLLFSRRLRHRQNRNLCPHCAYPIPTSVPTPQATLP